MATNIGPKIGIDGEAEYRAQINNIIQQQKTLNAEMQKATSVFDKDTSAKEKNRKQLELLNKQTEAQRDKVDKLREMYQKSAEKTGEASTATLKWKEALTQAETELAQMEAELKSATGAGAYAQQLKEAEGTLKSIGTGMQEAGKTLTKTVTGPIAALGTASIAAFKEIDAGVDNLAKMTGATGDNLKELQGIMEDLATEIPAGFDDISSSIGEVNTRFGVQGEQLRDLSEQYVKFAAITGTDVVGAVDLTQKALAAYGLGADDASYYLDVLAATSQATGVDTNKLAQGIVSNAAAFQELGLDISQATTFMGMLEKSGANSETVMNGMRKALKNAAAEGKTLDQALAELEDQILNGTDSMDGLTAAYDLFGKSGDQIYAAIQNGTLSFSDLAAAAVDASGTVSSTFTATLDPISEMQVAMNSAKVAGAELGTAMLTVAAPALQQVADWARQGAEWFQGLDESTQETIVKVAGLVAAVGPLLVVGGSLISGIGSIAGAVGGLIGLFGKLGGASGILASAIGFLSSPIGIATLSITGIIAAGVLLYQNWDTIKQKAAEIASAISTTWNNIKTTISTAINSAVSVVSSAIGRLKSIMNFSWSLPRLKLPHISVSGSFSLMPPSAPHFSISWYKKAYENAVMFTSPTVLGTSSGLKGFGDGNGGEIVIGANKLLETFTAAVQNAGGTGNTINVVVNPAPGMDEEELAELVAEKINDAVNAGREVFA